ncbi:afadin- and alpha-actinin-binding protein B-like isoform X2 [Polypterus senegalus]|uniref:afadin- and alpha-actinin-binding protein B-like isoform X2 n=1 Tax=Polypterus senegalus TaxID=55291 RepID=UPI001964C056|nr:afadin- and alpha-actinin-binding protein B-like isoform X2 [Polypterus senegalus]
MYQMDYAGWTIRSRLDMDTSPGLQDFVSRYVSRSRLPTSPNLFMSLPDPSSPSPGTLTWDQSTEQQLAYFSKEMALLGLPAPYEELSFENDHLLSSQPPDLACVLNSACSLLQLHQQTNCSLAELETTHHKMVFERNFLKSSLSKLQDQLSNFEKEMAALQGKEQQLQSQNRNLQTLVRTQKEEIAKLQGVLSSRAAHHSSDTKRKELQLGKMKERLQQLITDKKDRKASIDILNPLARADGKRATWKTGKSESRKDQEMLRGLVLALERQLSEAVLENTELKRTMEQLKEEDLSQTWPDCSTTGREENPKQEENMTCNKEMNQSRQEMVKNTLVGSTKKEWRSLGWQVEDMGTNIQGFTCGMPFGTDQDKEIALLRAEIEQSRQVIAFQQQLLQESVNSSNKKLPSSLRDSYVLEERERLRQQWNMFEQQKKRFEKERWTFTEAAIRLGRERKQFEEERAALLQQQFFNLTPFLDRKEASPWQRRRTFSPEPPAAEDYCNFPSNMQTPSTKMEASVRQVSTPSTPELFCTLKLFQDPPSNRISEVPSRHRPPDALNKKPDSLCRYTSQMGMDPFMDFSF